MEMTLQLLRKLELKHARSSICLTTPLSCNYEERGSVPCKDFQRIQFQQVARQSKNQKLQQQKQKATFRSSAAKKQFAQNQSESKKQNRQRIQIEQIAWPSKNQGLAAAKAKINIQKFSNKKNCPEPGRKQKAEPPKTAQNRPKLRT